MSTLRVVRSSAQSGVERAALDAALDLGYSVGGWTARGLPPAAEGPVPARYGVVETPSRDRAVALEWNVRDADGTLVLAAGRPTPEARAAVELAHRMEKPLLVADLLRPNVAGVVYWIEYGRLRSLNVLGPSEGAVPGVRGMAMEFLKDLLVAAKGKS